MKQKLIFRILSVWLSLTSFAVVSNAQFFSDTNVLKPLPRITGWADNEHYVVKRYDREERKDRTFHVNIKTGREKEYIAPERTPKDEVSVVNGDIVLSMEGGKKKLTNTPEIEKLPTLSPDGRWVAFLRNNDLYMIEIPTGKETRFTTDGSETILNGYASWVYYEEILGRSSNYRAFWWAPDSRNLVFFRFDDSAVPVFPLYNSEGQHGFMEKTRYPKAGDPNPEIKVGIASVNVGKVVWADFNPKDDQYFGTPIWRPDGSSLLVQWMPRKQNNLKLYEISLTSGVKKEIYHEEQATWINWINRFHWLKDGFLMVRDFDGWEQIYYHSPDGKLKQKLTNGKNWRTKIKRVDEKTQTVFYSSKAEISTREDFYSVRLDGKQQLRLTFGAFSHSKLLLSPNGQMLITTYSNVETPARLAIVNLKNGKITDIADSKGTDFNPDKLERREMVWLKTPEGFELPGRVVWPAGMEEGKKYPVIINIYGGPNYQAVSDMWSPPDTNKDMVIRMSFAHRGSGDNGKAGLNYLHRNLGKWEMNDYILWVKWLRENPQVDTAKIMITGGSYGGYLTAMALTYGAEYFKYGISNYPVTDWRLYDSHYTERYMDTPADNPEGYAFGSVMNHADNYGNYGPSMLLLQHGTMDDNVHIQNTYQLVDTLQKLNKPFELMVYPGQRHGWLGPKSRFTIQTREMFQNKYLFGKE